MVSSQAGSLSELGTPRDRRPYAAHFHNWSWWLKAPVLIHTIHKRQAEWELVQRMVTKIIKGLENLPYNANLKKLHIFSLEKVQRDVITICQYLKPDCREERGSPFARSHLEITRCKSYKMHWNGFHLAIGKKFSIVRSNNHWNNLPRNVVESPSLDDFKVWLERMLDNLI